MRAPVVFISYRRLDSDASAGRLHDALSKRLSGRRVFMDVDDVQAGDDFTRILSDALSGTDLMLAVIGPGWLTSTLPDGRRRLDDPNDFVLSEISEALTRKVPLIPVLVQGATMPAAQQLPRAIQALATRQALVLHKLSWDADVEALAARIETIVERKPPPMPWRLAIAVMVLVVAVASGILYWTSGRTADDRLALEQATADLRYGLPLETVKVAILDAQQRAVRDGTPEAVDHVVSRLKALVVNGVDTTDEAREIRARALETIKVLRQTDLTRDFAADDLKDADIVAADLGRASMRGLSLEGAFLLRTNFAAADLTGANLSATFARNTDFSAATLTGAKVSEFDWFNADGVTAEQLRGVELNTLGRCPKDAGGRASEAAFRAQLDDDYAFKWDQFPRDQEQLRRVWSEYGKPGGLCEQVDRWLDPTTTPLAK